MAPVHWYGLILLTAALQVCRCSDSEHRLIGHLFDSGYNKVIRPVQSRGEVVNVNLQIVFAQLIAVEEREQMMKTNLWLGQDWYDYRLSWNPEDFDNIDMVRVSSENIWRPDVVLFNNADGNYDIQLMTKAWVQSDGHVHWAPPVVYGSACFIVVKYFPFDRQNCTMKFGSWTYDADELDLTLLDGEAQMHRYKQNGEWDILRSPNRKYNADNRVYVNFDFIIKRKPLFYTINLIIPCILITSLSVLIFYLPADEGEKVTLGITVLLALIVFLLLIADIIPPTSLDVPLIGKYLLFTMIFVSVAIVATVYVLNVHHRTSSTHDMPDWVKAVFLEKLPRLLRMERPESEPPEPPAKEYNTWDHPPYFMKNVNGRSVETKGRNFGLRVTDMSGNPFKADSPRSGRFGQAPPSPSVLPKRLSPEARKALKNLKLISEYFRNQDEDDGVAGDWQYVAMVIDRICLWLFATVCFLGTLGLFLQPFVGSDEE
ncbi:neuronal acetylcholine receptor subunit beta-4-like isoform X1 [Branchiostoma lanceolatum]|uniref:neuronal acetylcholine receptor subunit beta-4-like isoform X1 n=2 Tax=Branchiostoma lanceolatum TaxID=7740 RepID=UPI00345635F5